MKKIFFTFLIPFMLCSCVKEVLNNVEVAKIEKKMVGRWYLKKIEPLNNQNTMYGLNFLYGEFNFQENNIFNFSTVIGESNNGTWQMSSKEETTNCYTAPDGSQVCNSVWNCLLYLDAVEVNGQQRKTASFESVKFQTDNNFTALIYVGYSGYRYSFERSR